MSGVGTGDREGGWPDPFRSWYIDLGLARGVFYSKTVTQYFLAQRIKDGQGDYVAKLKQLHAIIVYAMKTKQSLDTKNIDKLEASVKGFEQLYFKKAKAHGSHKN